MFVNVSCSLLFQYPTNWPWTNSKDAKWIFKEKRHLSSSYFSSRMRCSVWRPFIASNTPGCIFPFLPFFLPFTIYFLWKILGVGIISSYESSFYIVIFIFLIIARMLSYTLHTILLFTFEYIDNNSDLYCVEDNKVVNVG